MIPPFDDHGYLPPGVHPATFDEIADRFGQGSDLRRDEMESLRWLVDVARRAGVMRLVVNGSFVTDVPEPNDVDCALLIGPAIHGDPAAEAELLEGLPFLRIDLVEPEEFNYLVGTYYASDRLAVRKGLVEVNLWT